MKRFKVKVNSPQEAAQAADAISKLLGGTNICKDFNLYNDYPRFVFGNEDFINSWALEGWEKICNPEISLGELESLVTYVILQQDDLKAFDKFKDAQAELNSMSVDEANFLEITTMSKPEYSAIATIYEMVKDSNHRKELLDAFNSQVHEYEKPFVIEQLCQLCVYNEIEINYFAYLMTNVYNVGGYTKPSHLEQANDTDTANMNIKTYLEFAGEYIDKLVEQVYGRKFNISQHF